MIIISLPNTIVIKNNEVVSSISLLINIEYWNKINRNVFVPKDEWNERFSYHQSGLGQNKRGSLSEGKAVKGDSDKV